MCIQQEISEDISLQFIETGAEELLTAGAWDLSVLSSAACDTLKK